MSNMIDLPICNKCGWHWVMPHSDCNPAAGANAKQLLEIAEAMGVEATMHGYGQNRVCFKFAEDFTVVVRVNSYYFDLDHVHLLQSFEPADLGAFLGAFLALGSKVELDRRISDAYSNNPAMDE